MATMAIVMILSITLLVALVNCEPPATGYNYGPPGNHYLPSTTGFGTSSKSYVPPQSSGSGSYNGHGSHGSGPHGSQGHGHDSEVPKAYEFGYAVKDALSGNDYNRRETSDGNVVRGEYRVALPDGRTQIVTYHADWKSGFHADVRYEGEAKYPEPTRNVHQQGGYNYNAPSDFAGSLTGFHGNQGHKQPSSMHGPSGYQ